jgi:hypothetical protein
VAHDLAVGKDRARGRHSFRTTPLRATSRRLSANSALLHRLGLVIAAVRLGNSLPDCSLVFTAIPRFFTEYSIYNRALRT